MQTHKRRTGRKFAGIIEKDAVVLVAIVHMPMIPIYMLKMTKSSTHQQNQRKRYKRKNPQPLLNRIPII